MPIPQPEAMLGPDIMALVNDVISPSVADVFAQVPESSPAAPVDTLTSDAESPPAEPETPAAEAGSNTSSGDVLPAEAPQGNDTQAAGDLTAYQALLSGAYLRDLVSLQAKEHSTFAWVSVCVGAAAFAARFRLRIQDIKLHSHVGRCPVASCQGGAMTLTLRNGARPHYSRRPATRGVYCIR